MSEPSPLSQKCTNCGAELPPADAHGVSHCEFCKHSYRTEPEPPPPQPQVVQQIIVQQVVTSSVHSVQRTAPPPKKTSVGGVIVGCFVVAVLGFVGLAVLGMLVGSSTTTRPPRVSVPTSTPAPTPSWQQPYVPPAPVPSQPSPSRYPTPSRTSTPSRTPAPPPAHPTGQVKPGHR